MFGRLPEVIENKIFSYLIKQQDKKTISRVSKYFRKCIENISFFKEKRLLIDRVNMVIEELSDPVHQVRTNGHYKYVDSNLGNMWERFHKWDWPEPKIDPNYTPLWKPGMYVDVLDKVQVWGGARILAVEFRESIFSTVFKLIPRKSRIYFVQFLGWSDSFNEWVSPEKITFFGSKIIHPINIRKYLTGSHKRWALYRDNNEWRMNIIRVEDFNQETNEKTVTITNFYNNNFVRDVLTDDFIKDVRSVTDATVFLSVLSGRFEHDVYKREIKY